MPRSANDPLRAFTAFANPSTATDTVLVAAQPNRSIVVHAMFTVAAQANTVHFKSGTNVLTATSALAASRAILAGEHKGVKRGRPSKAEVEREKKLAAGMRENLDADLARLGISVVEGGRK